MYINFVTVNITLTLIWITTSLLYKQFFHLNHVFAMVEVEKIEKIGVVLNDPKRPLKERFRALFTLRNIGGPEAISCIEACFKDESALLKHELAYCLGQMQDTAAVPTLIAVLRDLKQEPMVRHEAGE